MKAGRRWPWLGCLAGYWQLTCCLDLEWCKKEGIMESRTKLLGHPIHPMLIVFPLGLFITSLIFDIIYLATSDNRWTSVAEYMIGAGVLGGLLAAVFGLLDWLAIPYRTRAKRIGLWHGGANVLVVVLFIISWFLD